MVRLRFLHLLSTGSPSSQDAFFPIHEDFLSASRLFLFLRLRVLDPEKALYLQPRQCLRQSISPRTHAQLQLDIDSFTKYATLRFEDIYCNVQRRAAFQPIQSSHILRAQTRLVYIASLQPRQLLEYKTANLSSWRNTKDHLGIQIRALPSQWTSIPGIKMSLWSWATRLAALFSSQHPSTSSTPGKWKHSKHASTMAPNSAAA